MPDRHEAPRSRSGLVFKDGKAYDFEPRTRGGWRIAELRTAADAPVRPEALAAVRAWFERKPTPTDPTPPFPEFLEAG